MEVKIKKMNLLKKLKPAQFLFLHVQLSRKIVSNVSSSNFCVLDPVFFIILIKSYINYVIFHTCFVCAHRKVRLGSVSDAVSVGHTKRVATVGG